MIDYLDSSFFIFLDSIFLQSDYGSFFDVFTNGREALGNADPVVKGVIPSLFAVAMIGVMLNFFNSAIRKKVVDHTKLVHMMKETQTWKKQRMIALKSKEQAKILELNRNSKYMNKISLEIMQMNMKPIIFTIIPAILIIYFVLPHLFAYTVALSPISLNVFPGNFFHLTCTAQQVANLTSICHQENALFLWAWYFLSSISFSGIIMKFTKSSWGIN